MEITSLNHSGLKTYEKILDMWNTDGHYAQILHKLRANIVGPAIERKISRGAQSIEFDKLSDDRTDNPRESSVRAMHSANWSGAGYYIKREAKHPMTTNFCLPVIRTCHMEHIGSTVKATSDNILIIP